MGVALRFLLFLVLGTIGGSVVTFLVTRNRTYLRFAWQVFKYSVIMVLIVFFFLALERLVFMV